MILNIILTLGISIIFTETSAIDCGNGSYADSFINGCYNTEENIIYLSYYSDNINKTFYHELGHAIFYKDAYSRIIIKDYPPLVNYCSGDRLENFPSITMYGNCEPHYGTEESRLNERAANYFAEYMLNPKNFSIYNPSLYIYFRDKLNNL